MSAESSRARVLFGTDKAVPEAVVAHAGPLEVVLRAGKLWHVRLGELEVWHGVAFPYRDAHWRTPEPVLELAHSHIEVESFRVRWVGVFPTHPAIDVTLEATGTPDGRIRYVGTAIPRGDIATNRLGACVMHPMSASGQAVEVEHIDGRRSASSFPVLIPPWPPFMLVRAIRHEFAPGLWGRCELSGDLFELEDQRNNADASFKTYGRSNMAPRPYVLRGGQAVRQSVELCLERVPPRSRSSRPVARPISIRCTEQSFAMPTLGVEADALDAGADERLLQALERLAPGQVHVRIVGSDPSIPWKRIGYLLQRAQSQLRLDLKLSDRLADATHDLDALRGALDSAAIVPESLAVFPSEQAWIDMARAHFARSAIGGGTPHFFVQLNRAENLGSVDFVTFTTASIVHGADDDIVMLGLQSLPSMVRTLNARYPGVAIRIGPSAIAAPSSPLGLSADSDGISRVALAAIDPRSSALYGAAWLLGYVSQLAVSGIEALTLARLGGPNALLAFTADGAMTKHPPFFVFERLTRASAALKTDVSDPARIAALLLERDGGRELIVANLAGESVDAALEGWPSARDMTVLDAESLRAFANIDDPWRALRRSVPDGRIRLGPYAVASLVDAA